MVQALNTFNLSSTVREPGIDNYLGIWNGKKFLVDDYDGSKWSLANMYWRYGYSIARALALIEKAIVAFSRIYSPQFLHNRAPKNTHASKSGYPWVSVSELVSSIKSESLAKQTLRDYLIHEHVSKQFAEEIGAAATRGNYAQDADQIHAFAGLVSMAASETASIQGGNSKLFEHMLEQSGAVVRRGREGDVTGIMKVSAYQSAPRWWVGTRDGYGQEFDAVIIAAPWLESGITLLNTEAVVPAYEYQNMHVTVVVTDAAQPDPVYFGYPDSYKDVPRTILTTPTEHPTFLSLAYVQTMENVVYGQAWKKLHVVKLFSHARMERDELQRIFGHGKIVWTYEKEWAAFPKLTPTNTLGFFVVDEGMYNINAMERLVSTMETSIVAAKNVAALLLQRWLGTRMVLGYHCKWDEGTPLVATKWAGWGCLSS
ncbi:hypothetical protein MVES1_001875 [Malassezia vespertilionis]|uniref:Prenylcysteine lyase domain-containing protein n=1 Tax=Malassezia vespertilionis TaxID=2020962 RepID=A0A2N1JDL5_9BASI|nr:uncharacterized protein MVES1_001875 [Malassezia vespertilionis]PKI84645.1 hypothetical protein MVES_001776 [Malassezia vespertilionis]WFD06526.1 hypothetical protein MVES1_001875 [Malassezia vespertilionis]